MERIELLKHIRTLELKAKGLSQHVFSGSYKSAFKGRGMSFSEVREYQFGDEVRTIDWNVTARYNHPYVKIFEEERDLKVMLLIDLSASTFYGTGPNSKRFKAIEIAATLAFSALVNNDKVGAILFTEEVEKYIHPKKGREHIWFILDQMISLTPKFKGTQIRNALKTLRSTQKKKCISFIISDFEGEDVSFAELGQTKKYHDLIAIKVNDKGEKNPVFPGFYQLVNPESGQRSWVNGFSAYFKSQYQSKYKSQDLKIQEALEQNKIPIISMDSNQDVIPPLKSFFRQRK